MSERRNIGIASPFIGDEEKAAVMEVLDSGMLVQGAKVAELEEKFAAFCGVKHGIATTNGTTALTVALLAHGIGIGDEVIIPSFSFVATATSVLSAGATPVFVDVEPDTFSMDPALIEDAITERTKAIMPVHLYGHPAFMPEIKAIADKHNLAIVEDSAQAHGAALDGQPVGGWGMAAFSFYPSKNMTTGEGGMVTTNDDDLAAQARMMRNHGMSQQYLHEIVGFNFRMTNVLAAIGVVQMERLPDFNAKRIANATYLNEHLTSVRTPITREGARHVFHQYTVLVPEGADRDAAVKQLNDAGIGARVYYPLPIHCQPVFRKDRSAGDTCACGHGLACPHLPQTIALTKRVFSLPVHPNLSQEDLDYIVEHVNGLSF
jgi:perosamine synthetase